MIVNLIFYTIRIAVGANSQVSNAICKGTAGGSFSLSGFGGAGTYRYSVSTFVILVPLHTVLTHHKEWR